MTVLRNKLLIAITGSIAAYKSVLLVREAVKAGYEVKVVLTKAAQEFVTPLTLQVLSQNRVYTEMFDLEAERAMGHIELARWADMILIAPATANIIAKLAHGYADDLLSTLILAKSSDIPVYIAPAMNVAMYNSCVVADNIKKLVTYGYKVLNTGSGEQACGENGEGRMLEVAELLEVIDQELDNIDPESNYTKACGYLVRNRDNNTNKNTVNSKCTNNSSCSNESTVNQNHEESTQDSCYRTLELPNLNYSEHLTSSNLLQVLQDPANTTTPIFDTFTDPSHQHSNLTTKTNSYHSTFYNSNFQLQDKHKYQFNTNFTTLEDYNEELLQPYLEQFKGKKVLVTAGPTREMIDPVRYITNHSSGKMGFYIALAAQKFGAQVTVVAGPVTVEIPDGLRVIKVESADQMNTAVLEALIGVDVFIGCAAVSDFKAKKIANHKIKKTGFQENITLQLVKNTDILYNVSHSAHRPKIVIGFAAETQNLEEYARTKIISKGCDAICANDVSQENQGWNSDYNRLVVYKKNGSSLDLGYDTKQVVATRLVIDIMKSLVTM